MLAITWFATANRLTCLLAASLLMACAAPAPRPTSQAESTAPAAPSSPKRVTLALLLDPVNIRQSQARLMGELTVAALSVEDAQGIRHPQLAEELPSTERGTWQVFPDGRMDTTWRLREGTRWHDGQPLTTDDLLFSAQVAMDREQTFLREPSLDLTDGIEALDSRTIVIHWKQTFIDADLVFQNVMPRHLLEARYLESKSQLEALPFWLGEYVGAGPFRMREWIPGNHAVLDAFPEYVLGRPKIDQVEVKFITDANTLVANVLAGTVDITAPRALSIEQGLTIKERWGDGRMVPYVDGWTMMYPQLNRPSPAVIGDPQFRRALVHAIDRQQLAETLTAGYAPVAHSIISPEHPEYRGIESSIVKLDYEPRRALQLMESTGLTRGPDGMFRDTSGVPLTLKIQTTVNDTNQKTALATADFWQRVGLTGDVAVISPAMVGVWQDRYSYPGFDLVNQGSGVRGLKSLLHSAAAPLPERNYTAPNAPYNRGSYLNPEYDALLDRYFTTIPAAERMQALARVIHWQTDLQLVIGFFHSVNAVTITNRFQRAIPGTSWNAHEWDIAG
jgi:peptide/nickel transport system substrate-binding protein